MLKGLVMDENISNLTFASGEVSASSGSRIETGAIHPQHSFDSTNQPPPKKKKSFPGNPDPDAEVIALSPNSLQTTNRFICEICNKGFKRDQNLQLHRRGHNLPWKLKQRTNKEVKKKVYVCPEVTCVHHDPSRALGDLTGIKKHFSRKHGEKKWKCEKCSKRYAVQSDWKAHSRICGTREYRCDCGTLFSRRDSFITHRAFCDALAEESVNRAIAVNPILSSQQPGSSASHLINLQALSVKREQDENQHLLNPRPEYSIPPWLVYPPIGEAGTGPPQVIPTSQLFPENFDQSFLQHGNPSTNPTVLPPFQYSSTATPHMSATALLQRAAQMGVTMSKPSPSPAAIPRPHQGHMSNQNPGFSSTLPATPTASSGLFLSSREEMGGEFGHGLVSLKNKGSAVTSGIMEHLAASDAGGGHYLQHDMMSFLSSAIRFDGSSFDSEDFNGMLIPKRDGGNFQGILSKSTESQFRRNDHDVRTSTAGSPRGGESDGLTRDFLSLKAFPHKDWLDHINPSTYGQRNQNLPPPWQG